MASISFTKNHNGKLQNDVFTSIRGHTDKKLLHYESLLYKEFDVWIKGKSIPYCQATLKRVTVKKYYEVSIELKMIDTGYTNLTKIKQLFEKFGIKSGEDEVILLTFETEPNQNTMFPKKRSL